MFEQENRGRHSDASSAVSVPWLSLQLSCSALLRVTKERILSSCPGALHFFFFFFLLHRTIFIPPAVSGAWGTHGKGALQGDFTLDPPWLVPRPRVGPACRGCLQGMPAGASSCWAPWVDLTLDSTLQLQECSSGHQACQHTLILCLQSRPPTNKQMFYYWSVCPWLRIRSVCPHLQTETDCFGPPRSKALSLLSYRPSTSKPVPVLRANTCSGTSSA